MVWPETVAWDEDQDALLIDGEPVPWSGEKETVVSGGGGEIDFVSTAALWDDDVTPETAPCHFAAGGAWLFNADSELEVTHPEG